MTTVADEYWAGCAAGELRYQVCPACAAVGTYPREFCESCGGHEIAWRISRRHGVVRAMTIVQRAPSAEFARLAPYRLCLVDLDEGFRIMAHGNPMLVVGDPTSIRFQQTGVRMIPFADVRL